MLNSKNPKLINRLIFLLLIFVIGMVCVYDTILSICFAAFLPFTEQNPLCRLIIDNGGVKQLVMVKSTTTIVGVCFLFYLAYTRFRICVVITFILSLMLFFYLTFQSANGDYNLQSFILEEGPIDHFFKFYYSMDEKEMIEKLVQ